MAPAKEKFAKAIEAIKGKGAKVKGRGKAKGKRKGKKAKPTLVNCAVPVLAKEAQEAVPVDKGTPLETKALSQSSNYLI